jgi:xylulokinase
MSFPSYDPRLPLQTQLTASYFTLLNIPISSDTSSHTHALALESLLGGPDHMAARVGISAQPAMIAAQLLRMRDSSPNAETWARTGRVQVASAFIASLVAGKWVSMGESEACASGAWNHQAGEWDDGVLEIIGGSRDEGRRVKSWLGEVEIAAGGKRVGTISKYLTERYGFDPGEIRISYIVYTCLSFILETIVTQFTADYLSTYLSLCPSPSDAVLSFGPLDVMLSPAQHYVPTRLYTLFPHPTQEAGEKKRYIAMLSSR